MLKLIKIFETEVVDRHKTLEMAFKNESTSIETGADFMDKTLQGNEMAIKVSKSFISHASKLLHPKENVNDILKLSPKDFHELDQGVIGQTLKVIDQLAPVADLAHKHTIGLNAKGHELENTNYVVGIDVRSLSPDELFHIAAGQSDEEPYKNQLDSLMCFSQIYPFKIKTQKIEVEDKESVTIEQGYDLENTEALDFLNPIASVVIQKCIEIFPKEIINSAKSAVNVCMGNAVEANDLFTTPYLNRSDHPIPSIMRYFFSNFDGKYEFFTLNKFFAGISSVESFTCLQHLIKEKQLTTYEDIYIQSITDMEHPLYKISTYGLFAAFFYIMQKHSIDLTAVFINFNTHMQVFFKAIGINLAPEIKAKIFLHYLNLEGIVDLRNTLKYHHLIVLTDEATQTVILEAVPPELRELVEISDGTTISKVRKFIEKIRRAGIEPNGPYTFGEKQKFQLLYNKMHSKEEDIFAEGEE